MSTGLSKEDLERIQRFSKTPAYARTPEMLMPDGEHSDE